MDHFSIQLQYKKNEDKFFNCTHMSTESIDYLLIKPSLICAITGGLDHGGMTPAGLQHGGMTPGGMTPAGLGHGGMTPVGLTHGGMTPAGLQHGGLTPSGK